MKVLLLGNAAVVCVLVGLIWTIQLVHYPLFARVGAAAFSAYESEHIGRITLLVLPLMLAEAGFALLLVVAPPEGIPIWQVWAGLGLVAVVWLMTFFVNVPQHAALGAGFDSAVHQSLVSSNWVRTLAWSAHGVLALLWVYTRMV